MRIRVTHPVPETYTSASSMPPGEYRAEKARSRQLSDSNGRPCDGWWVYGERRAKYSVMDYDWARAVKSGAIEEIKEG